MLDFYVKTREVEIMRVDCIRNCFCECVAVYMGVCMWEGSVCGSYN